MYRDSEVTQREFLCCARHLYWNSYHIYDTSLSSECSISDTSLSSSVSFMGFKGSFSDELSKLSSSGTSSSSPDSTASSSASEFADTAWFEASLTNECVSSSVCSYEKRITAVLWKKSPVISSTLQVAKSINPCSYLVLSFRLFSWLLQKKASHSHDLWATRKQQFP